MKVIEDAIFDLARRVAYIVYKNSETILDEASEGLLDDDVDQLEMNESDLLDEIVREEMMK